MKKSLFVLAMLCFGFFSFAPAFIAETPYPAAYANAEGDYNKAELTKILPDYMGVRSLKDLGLKIMDFLGRTIIMVSVLGIMIGGGFWVFSNGDEGMVSKGKDMLLASIVGLSVTMLAYAIIMLVQSVLYNIG